MFAINGQWLHETLMRLIKPLLSKRTAQILDPDLTLLGAMQVDGAEVPVYFARRLNDPKTAQRLDVALRARDTTGIGIILAESEEMPLHLGSNVVVPLLSHLASATRISCSRAMASNSHIETTFRSLAGVCRRASFGQTGEIVDAEDDAETPV